MRLENRYLFIEDVYKSYGEKVVLDNIDLVVDKGELCTLVGPSGCGKSTLFRILVGEEQPTKGKVLLEGEELGAPVLAPGEVIHGLLAGLDGVEEFFVVHCHSEAQRGIPLLIPPLLIKGFLLAALVEMTGKNNIMFFVVKIFFNTGSFFLIFLKIFI